VEESKKIKEKKKEAIIIDNKEMSTEDLKKDAKKSTQDLKKEEKKPSVCGDYNCLTSQPLTNHSFVNNAAVDLALKMTEKALEDPFFPVDLDTYCSLDMLNGKSK